MSREVVILGVGMTKFERASGKSLEEFSWEAGNMALKDAGVEYSEIQAGFATHCNLGSGLSSNFFSPFGLTAIPISRVECACASQSRGVYLAAEAIAAGAYDMAMVIGIEIMPRGMAPVGGDPSNYPYEARLGLLSPFSQYATLIQRHMDLYGTKKEHLAKVAMKDHKNASLNPRACYRDVYTMDEILNSRMIADPLTLYMCSANCDGATATVLCSKEKARQYTTKPIRLIASEAGSQMYKKKEWIDGVGPIELIANRAYESAGVGPEDIDVCQLHNAMSPNEIFHIEDLSFCPRGEGGAFVWEGNTEIFGKIPVNTDGGLAGRGHPLGATGGAMIAELVWQLRGQAGERQVKNPKVALLENDGGGGSNVMIFSI